jgi:hypothetical protein
MTKREYCRQCGWPMVRYNTGNKPLVERTLPPNSPDGGSILVKDYLMYCPQCEVKKYIP